MERDIKGFLQELGKLSEKYGITIGGCGCCGSPALDDIETGYVLATHLEYDDSKQAYVAIMKE